MSQTEEEIIHHSSKPLDAIPTELSASTPPIPGIRAVLFDIYGTLLISGSGDIGIAEPLGRSHALVEALQSTGYKYSGDPDSAVKEFRQVIERHHEHSRSAGVGFPEVNIIAVWREVTEQFYESGELNQQVTDKHLSRLAVEFEVRVNPVWPMPAMADCLAKLRGMGMVLGIISNAQFFTPLIFSALLKKDLDQLGFAPELRYYSYRHGLAKPGQELYQLAKNGLAERNIECSEVLYVGNDMRNDIWPAAEVGFRTGLFAGDKRSLRLRQDEKEKTARQTPDAIITDLMQIPPMIETPGGTKAEFDG